MAVIVKIISTYLKSHMYIFINFFPNVFTKYEKNPSKTVGVVDSSTQNPNAHLQYVHDTSAKFQKHPSKTVTGADYTNSIPYSVKKLPKMTKFERL